jgi:hypothetical protein
LSTIDWRGRHLINEFHRGRLRQDQVCDAHPELIRAARNVGTPASMPCPICREEQLFLVTYVFGSRLPSHGRCVSTAAELAKLNSRSRSVDRVRRGGVHRVPMAPSPAGAADRWRDR